MDPLVGIGGKCAGLSLFFPPPWSIFRFIGINWNVRLSVLSHRVSFLHVDTSMLSMLSHKVWGLALVDMIPVGLLGVECWVLPTTGFLVIDSSPSHYLLGWSMYVCGVLSQVLARGGARLDPLSDLSMLLSLAWQSIIWDRHVSNLFLSSGCTISSSPGAFWPAYISDSSSNIWVLKSFTNKNMFDFTLPLVSNPIPNNRESHTCALCPYLRGKSYVD